MKYKKNKIKQNKIILIIKKGTTKENTKMQRKK